MRLWDGLRWLMAALFALSAALQLNDPDPLGWVAIYLLAAFATLVPDCRRLAFDARAVGALTAGGWAGWMGWQLWSSPDTGPGFMGLFQSMDAAGAVEPMRELGGLIIVTVWLAVAAGVARRLSRRITT